MQQHDSSAPSPQVPFPVPHPLLGTIQLPGWDQALTHVLVLSRNRVFCKNAMVTRAPGIHVWALYQCN